MINKLKNVKLSTIRRLFLILLIVVILTPYLLFMVLPMALPFLGLAGLSAGLPGIEMIVAIPFLIVAFLASAEFAVGIWMTRRSLRVFSAASSYERKMIILSTGLFVVYALAFVMLPFGL